MRDNAMKQMEKYKGVMARYYNKKVKWEDSTQATLSLEKFRRRQRTHLKGNWGQHGKEPKKIRHSREGSYHLKTLDGQELPRPWNIEHLKRYYQ